MSIGEMATDPRISFYTAPRAWSATALRALAARTKHAAGTAAWQGQEIDGYVADDRSQWWEQRWLSSYRTVLIQRAQSLQRQLNTIYSRQLAGALYRPLDRDPNYSMANLQRMGRDPSGTVKGPLEGVTGSDASLFSLDLPFAGGTKARKDQDPISYLWGKPPQTSPASGPDWSAMEQDDFGDWISRQYQQPDMPFDFPNPLDYLKWHTADSLLAPSSGRFELGLGYFDVAGFVGALFSPLLYPLFFQRLETFSHSEAGHNAIDAATIRSAYQFRLKSMADFPLLGPAMGSVIGLMAGMLGSVPIPRINPNDPSRLIELIPPPPPTEVASAMDLLLHAQPWIGSPKKTETEPGAFFATTAALQDWGLQELDYRYFSAARYQQEAIDTDMLAAFRKAGSTAIKLLINTVLIAAPPIKMLAMLPFASTIFDAILSYASNNLMNMVLRPIRDLIELDPQYEIALHPEVEADGASVYHVGDPPGLFGLTAPWEMGGFAGGYALAEDPTNRTEINSVEILTKRHTLTDLWDGQGIASQQHALERRQYEGISSRLVNVGMQPQTPLDLAEFRTQVFQGRTTGSGLGSYSRKDDDYSLAGKSLLGSQIQVGTNVLNPGFGGGVLMTDILTTRLDTFFYGSIARAPMHGDFADVFAPGAVPAGQPGAPTFDPASGLTAANAGAVTFVPGPDGIPRYTFAAVPPGTDGSSGLRVTYRGRDTLRADGSTPQFVDDARESAYYQVTDRKGQPITASVITRQHPMQVTAHLPTDWTGPADPLLTAATGPGVVDLDLSSRVQAAPQEEVTPARDTDSGHVNASRLTFLPPDAVTRLRQSPPLLGSEGAPGSGGEFQVVGGPATDFGNLAAPGNGWVDWHFVAKASGDDYNRDGSIQAGSLSSSGNQSVVEAPSAIKEAVHTWGDLVQQFVPAKFRLSQPILTGNDATGQPYTPEAWNTAYLPDARILDQDPGSSPRIASNPPMAYSASSPPPPTAVNPYFWSGSDGYQYITIWDGAVTTIPSPRNDAEIQASGLPDPNGTPPARIRAVLRIKNGTDQIEVLGDGTAVLLHRQTQLSEVPATMADAMFADLRAKGYTQGRAETDTGSPPLYDLAQNPQPSPPPGTPADFTIVGRQANGAIQVAFTRPYDGLVTIPPNRDGAGNPVDTWSTVNGWYLSEYNDANPAQGWSGSPAGNLQASPTGQGLIWGAAIPGGQDGTGGKQLTDRITVAKTFTLGAPADAPAMNGKVLPGESVAISLAGANTGLTNHSFQKLTQVRIGTASHTLDHGVIFEPDRFLVTVTNSKGTRTLPPLKADGSGGWRPETPAEAVGMAQVTVPSDLLADGDNTVKVEVQKGGIYQRFCRSEPPADQTDPASMLAAGYWVNTDTVTDRDGNTWAPGNLFFENRMVGDGSGRYVVLAGSDVIHRNNNPFGPGVAGMDVWIPVEVNSLTWKPDSYDPDRSFDMQLYPLIMAASGGYQRKADIRAGVRISTEPTRQTLHTYALETVDRYRYDPATQRILDVLPPVATANTMGPLWQGGPVGHLTTPAMVAPSGGERNAWYQSPNNTADPPIVGGFVPGTTITSGQTPVGTAPVGRTIDRTNRQVFGSDDNQLVRHLYAAMKIVDPDGYQEDQNGNGVLDKGEDLNGNLILDAGEDVNGNGTLDLGEDGNGDGILQGGPMAADARLYREYRDAFNMGYLDHLTIVGSASAASGGNITSTVEVRWRPDGDGNVGNNYRQNYEYYASEADRQRKRLTTKRHAELLMASYHAFRKA